MRWLKRLFYLAVLLFIILNVVIYNHAYNFTHFVEKDIPKFKATTKEDLGDFQDQLRLAFSGVETPKLKNSLEPQVPFEMRTIGSNPSLNTWWIPTTDSLVKGVVILFHGYSSNKSSLLGPSSIFRKLGYHTMLVDFRGHGESEGTTTSIGYYEAEDVKQVFDHIRIYYDLPVCLYGTSMGAVSILKAVHDYSLDVERLIVEAPFASMSSAVHSRFENMGLPSFLLPQLLLFWGGVQCNMNAFEHDAVAYAKKVTTPTLHLYGQKDPKVRQSETDAIFNALAGPRYLTILENSAHDTVYEDDPSSWTAAVWGFMEKPISSLTLE